MNTLITMEATHYQELADVALQFTLYWKRYADCSTADRYGNIVEDNEFELFDGYLAECLLSHLKDEFIEFADIGDWRDLLNINRVTPTLTQKFHFVGHRRTFTGMCPLCSSYELTLTKIKTTDVIDKYFDVNRLGWSPTTVKNYRSTLNQFAKLFELLPQTTTEINQFIEKFNGDSTRRSYFKTLEWFYKFAENEFGAINIMAKLSRPKVKRKEPEYLDDIEAKRLFAVEHSDRDLAALLVMYSSGARVGEVSRLKFKHIQNECLVIPHKGKTGSRFAPLMPQTKLALLALRNGHGDDDNIFWGEHPHAPLGVAGLEGLVKKAFAKAGLPAYKAHPHAFRHSTSGAYESRGLTTSTIQKMFGHSSIQTTQGYMHTKDNDMIKRSLAANPLNDILQPDHKLSEQDPAFSLWYTSVKGIN